MDAVGAGKEQLWRGGADGVRSGADEGGIAATLCRHKIGKEIERIARQPPLKIERVVHLVRVADADVMPDPGERMIERRLIDGRRERADLVRR